MIAARAKISRGEDRATSDLPFQVEIILQRVRELRMVSGREDIDRLRQRGVPRVEEAGKDIGTQAEKGRKKTVHAIEKRRELIAKDAGAAPEHGLAVAEDVPGEPGLRRN